MVYVPTCARVLFFSLVALQCKILKKSGLQSHQLRHFYLSVIRPILEYCSPGWYLRHKPVGGGSKAGGHPTLPFPSPPPFHSPYISDKPVGGKVRSSEGEVPRLPPYKYHPAALPFGITVSPRPRPSHWKPFNATHSESLTHLQSACLMRSHLASPSSSLSTTAENT